MSTPTRLERAFEIGFQPGNSLKAALSRIDRYEIAEQRDVDALADALGRYDRSMEDSDGVGSALHDLTSLFQQVADRETARNVRERCLPKLIAIYDRIIREFPKLAEAPYRLKNDVMFMLKIFAMYQDEQATERVLAAALKPADRDEYMWSIVFNQFAGEHPYADQFVDAFREELPEGFMGIAYLDVVNALAREQAMSPHPFDTPAGAKRLESALTSSDPKEGSYAHSATAALPFISDPPQGQLLALAMDHADVGVQMEAAWASAHLGGEGGVKLLKRFSLDPRHSSRACMYLEELGREADIPAEALEPDFAAMAEMCQWLSHPMEFGRTPNAIEQLDTRMLHWPPTDDRRRLWLFRYTFEPEDDDDERTVGVGMVGSVTWSMLGEEMDLDDPMSVYAIHCCWELQSHGDARAPKERTVEAGLRILKEANE